jgi:ribosomal protein S18 acetylase RimI-like enzyme
VHPTTSREATYQTYSAENDVIIRDSQFEDLRAVADVIISSFYENSTSPWNQFYRMGELNRIQQSFPYADKELHRMLVAVSIEDKKERVVGFCDIDARTPNRQTSYTYNPRPYLSDLCICPKYRRKGIARSLIQACEDFCVEQISREEVFIRVEKNNVAALDMYTSMGYYDVENPDDPEGHIVLLTKKLEIAAIPSREDEYSNTRLDSVA